MSCATSKRFCQSGKATPPSASKPGVAHRLRINARAAYFQASAMPDRPGSAHAVPREPAPARHRYCSDLSSVPGDRGRQPDRVWFACLQQPRHIEAEYQLSMPLCIGTANGKSSARSFKNPLPRPHRALWRKGKRKRANGGKAGPSHQFRADGGCGHHCLLRLQAHPAYPPAAVARKEQSPRQACARRRASPSQTE